MTKQTDALEVNRLVLKKRCVGRVENFDSSNLIPLSFNDIDYFKEQYFSSIENSDEILDTERYWWVEREAIERGEYGNVFYVTKTVPWNWCKVYKCTISRIKHTMGEAFNMLWNTEEVKEKPIILTTDNIQLVWE